MPTDITKALDRLEYNSKLHRAWDAEIYPVAKFWDEMAISPEGSRDGVYSGALWTRATWKQAFVPSGAVATVPSMAAVLKAAGLLETILAVTSVTYSPHVAFTHTALTVDQYKGNQYKCSCANMAVKQLDFEFEPDKPVVMTVDGFGTYVAPSDAAGSAVIDTAIGTLAICKAMSLNIGGLTARIKKAKLTIENMLGGEPDEDIAGTNGCMTPQIGDRVISWEATVRLPLNATVNWWTANIVANAPTNFNLAGGTGAGNLFSFACPGYLNDAPDYGGDIFHEVTLKGRENLGGSRLAIILT